MSAIADRAIRAALRKYEKADGYSFPSFNVPPLLRFANNEEKSRAAQFRKVLGSKNPPGTRERDKELSHLLSVSTSGWVRPDKNERGKDEMDQVNGCLSSVVKDLQAMLGESTDRSRSFLELLRRAQRTNGNTLYEQLKQTAIRAMKLEPYQAAEWMDILFFCSGKEAKKFALVLELNDQSQFAYPANHPQVQDWVNGRLLEKMETDSTRTQRNAVALDAFGVHGGGMNDSFPEVKMSVLGNVKLRAMSSESPCQRRYRSSDAKSFPASQPIRQDMKNALEWITRDERRGRTWSDVSSLGGASAMLIAYPSELPSQAPELAGLFCGVEEEQSDPDGLRFEACSRRVVRTLQGQPASLRKADLHVFVLTKPDGFRTKVLHSSCYSLQHLLDSAEGWQVACRDSPPIEIRQFDLKKGDKPIRKTPLTPFPAQVVWCLNTNWQQMGMRAETTFGLQVSDALSLLLADGPVLRTVATRAVRLATRNSLSLLLAIGQATHQGKVHRMTKGYSKQALLLPRILALLLRKLGSEKGTYMKSPPYLIGRLLSLADQLHVQYCREVRKGQIPPQLVGNSLMTSAMETPEKALSLLWQRIKPYHAWAQTVQGGDEVGLAKYFLGEIGRVCAALSESALPSRCSEADKVAMLLGYLARSGTGKRHPDSSNSLTEGEQQ